jgi:subtilisin-like proprotein convertase family protein
LSSGTNHWSSTDRAVFAKVLFGLLTRFEEGVETIMKRALGSFIAINRKAFLLLGLLAGLAVFGLVSSRIDAQNQEGQQSAGGEKTAPESPSGVFSNPAPIVPADRASNNAGTNPGLPPLYPSTINVSGMTGTITKVTVTFAVTSTFPDDLDILLVHPDGTTRTLLMSDAGGSGDPVALVYTFDQAAATAYPDGGTTPVPAGSYRPSNFLGLATPEPGGADNFPAPGPGLLVFPAPTMDVFNGLTPNGNWSLYVVDDQVIDTMSLPSGWSIDITTSGGGPPALGTIIISEFRVRGPSGANDEFIEIFNRSLSPHTVVAASGTGYGVAASDGTTRCSVPNGTIIPGGGHYLCTNSVAYSISGYPAGNGTTATGDATYTTDIPDNAGIALFNNNTGGGSYTLANRLDAVGSTSEANTLYKEGAGYPALTPFSIDYSWYRISSGMTSAVIADPTFPLTSFGRDTNDNATDLVFVDTNGTSAGGGQRLGSPGPENLSSPLVHLTGFTRNLIDSTIVGHNPPNSVRDFTSDPANNSTFGTLSVRRRFVNSTGVPITRLRFRVLKQTTFPAPSGFSDLRTRNSGLTVVAGINDPATCLAANGVPTIPCTVNVLGTTLETPPSQPNGGAFNGTYSVGTVTLGTPLAPGGSVIVGFLFGIQQTGTVMGSMGIEALPRGGATWNFRGHTDNDTTPEDADEGVIDINNPTAASVSIGGRVLTADGRGLTNARVTITGPDGVARTAITSSFGYYSFDGVESGASYVVAVGSKRYIFTPRTVQVVDNISDLDFVAEP